MTLINRHNYESYIIDYLDGKLAGPDKEKLLLFLEENPDIKEEFELIDDISLKKENLTFDDKENLKRNIVPEAGINENNYTEKFIAFHEGELSDKEKFKVKEFLSKNNFLQKDFDLFSKAYLKPDTSVVFENKNLLKHKSRRLVIWTISSSIAAALIIIFGFLFLFKSEKGLIPRKNTESTAAIIKALPDTAKITREKVNKKYDEKEIKNNDQTAAKIDKKEYSDIKRFAKKQKPLYSENNTIVKLNNKNADIALVPKVYYEKIRNKHLYRNPVIIEKQRKRSFTGKLFANVFKKAKNEIPLPANVKTDFKEPRFAKFMDKGIMVFSTLTGAQPDIEKLYNSNGDLIAYKISGEQFRINKSFSK